MKGVDTMVTLDKEKLKELKKRATKIRMHVIEATYNACCGHPGGSLSCADILSVLYFHEMRIDPSNPGWPDRDRFILSKGHCSPALYGALAERGFFPADEIKKFRHIDSYLQGHPDMRKVPGVEISSGSLGQGLSAANGMALAARLDGKNYRVFVLMGDGEIEEGQIWEAAMTSAHYGLDNVTAFLDHNGLQIDGRITEVMSPEPVDEKFKAFGWNVISINGHDYMQIVEAVEQAGKTKGKPTIIIAETIKGKDVSFMENEAGWHGMAPNAEQYEKAMSELKAILDRLEVE